MSHNHAHADRRTIGASPGANTRVPAATSDSLKISIPNVYATIFPWYPFLYLYCLLPNAPQLLTANADHMCFMIGSFADISLPFSLSRYDSMRAHTTNLYYPPPSTPPKAAASVLLFFLLDTFRETVAQVLCAAA